MKKQVAFRLEQQIIKKLKILAVEHDKTVTDLLLEAIEWLFKKYKVDK